MTAVKEFKEYIAKSSMRMTREREKVIRVVFDISDHFTVSDLIGKLKSKDANIARSTVYRLIPHLLDSGLIRKAPNSDCSEEQVYEPITKGHHHDHLICDHCGEVIEFEENAIEILQEKVAKQYGYKLKKHHLELVGVCPSCQEKIIERAVKAW